MKLRTPAFLAACMLASASHASFVHNNSGLTAPDQTIDFDSVSLAHNASVTTEFQAQGVSFSNAFANPDSAAYSNMVDNRIGNFMSNVNQAGLFSIVFSQALTGAAFAMVTAPGGQSTFQALLNGSLVESASAATSTFDPVNFFGFQGIVFDEITISVDSFDRALMIDSLQTIATVPEPQTRALVLAALVALGSLRRRWH
jgi:MYXO-CTERM domain-containing protein